MDKKETIIEVKDAKKLFRKLGACSSTMYYILNREFGQQREIEVRAAEPLAGGIMQNGYQCGMLWGSVMAAGAEAFRRFPDQGRATAVAIIAAQKLMASFQNRTGGIDCIDVTQTDWHNKFSIAKFMLTGKFLSCFRLIENWAPEAINAAYEGLSDGKVAYSPPPLSCAYEVAKKLGAGAEEAMTVAGFAGGMGLSGGGCGVLAAAVWWKSLEWCRNNPKKSSFNNPAAKKVVETFMQETDCEFLCSKITGKQFGTVEEHSEFLRGGGCGRVMGVLAGV